MKKEDVSTFKSNNPKINEKWPKHGATRNVNCFYDPCCYGPPGTGLKEPDINTGSVVGFSVNGKIGQLGDIITENLKCL
jgi:hypothetical protein